MAFPGAESPCGALGSSGAGAWVVLPRKWVAEVSGTVAGAVAWDVHSCLPASACSAAEWVCSVQSRGPFTISLVCCPVSLVALV